MTPEIEAKKIEYEGTLFDSQLEADWAASLTSWGVAWRYHPGNVPIMDDTGTPFVWQPDFALMEGDAVSALLEVKGPHGERLWKAELAEREHELPVLIGRQGIVIPGTDNQVAGAVWHGVRFHGAEWVLAYERVGDGWRARFTQDPLDGADVRVSAERCMVRPEASGVVMRKALGQWRRK